MSELAALLADDLLCLARTRRLNDSELLVEASLRTLRARRGEMFVHAAGRGMTVHTAGEQVLYLPNGTAIRVATDDSGVATQVEEDERLHAVVRPHTIRTSSRR